MTFNDFANISAGYTGSEVEEAVELDNESIVQSKAARLQERLNAKKKKLGIHDDADSGTGYRMLGYDAPEVWHHGEKERSKVYKQYAELNNVDMATAKAMVDAQSDAYETDNKYRNSAQFIVDKAIANKKMDGSEKYYNAESLGKFILDERDTDKDVAKSQMTAFDIFGAGERATDYAEKYTETNPNGLTDPAGFATDTDKKGAYGRRLIEDKKLATEMIANGEAIPGSNDPIEYAEQMKLFNKAKKEKKGLFASKSGTRVLEAMQ